MTEIKFGLLDVDYTLDQNSEPVIRLFGKTLDGKSIVAFDRDFEPYFYALPKEDKEADDVAKEIKKLDGPDFIVKKTKIIELDYMQKKRKVVQVIMRSTKEVPKIRDIIRGLGKVENVFEADILFARRYLFCSCGSIQTPIENDC